MVTTVDRKHWNSSNGYHQSREPASRIHVRDCILPTAEAYLSLLPEGVSIADFACGLGSVAEGFILECLERNIKIDRFVLIDVVEDNISIACERIRKLLPANAVETYLCNGHDFHDYQNKKVDYLYCWDAMVHFDILDVAGYLYSLSNVVQGRAFFHHSNFSAITKSVGKNPHSRNFMSKEIFQQMCISARCEVISQEVISWGKEKRLDCITTVDVS